MTVLLIEDDEFIRMIYISLLEKEGFTVLVEKNGVEGLKAIKKAKPDIILLDIILPEMTGYDILEEKRKLRSIKSIPVIVISNLCQESDIKKAKKLGVQTYLPKVSYLPSEVVDEIKRLKR